MVYKFEKFPENLYAIEVGDKIYGLLVDTAVPHLAEGHTPSVHVSLLNENGNMVCNVVYPFSFIHKSFREGSDAAETMLAELAAEAKQVANVDLFETFKEIRKHMKRN